MHATSSIAVTSIALVLSASLTHGVLAQTTTSPAATNPPPPVPSTDTYVPHQNARPTRFEAADGLNVFAAYYGVRGGDDKPIALMFHEPGSNGVQFRELAVRLNAHGWNCLVVDLRTGDTDRGRSNLTKDNWNPEVNARRDALVDMEAALKFVESVGAKGGVTIWAMGETVDVAAKFVHTHHDRLIGFVPIEPVPRAYPASMLTVMPVAVPTLSVAAQCIDDVLWSVPSEIAKGSYTVMSVNADTMEAQLRDATVIWPAIEMWLNKHFAADEPAAAPATTAPASDDD